MFAREPDAALGAAMAERLDVFVEADFSTALIIGAVPADGNALSISYGISVGDATILQGLFARFSGWSGGQGADLEIGVAAPAGEFVVLPVGAETACGMAGWGGGVVVGQERIVRAEEFREQGVVFR